MFVYSPKVHNSKAKHTTPHNTWPEAAAFFWALADKKDLLWKGGYREEEIEEKKLFKVVYIPGKDSYRCRVTYLMAVWADPVKSPLFLTQLFY